MHNFFESPICMGKERLKDPKHPTQKPIKLLEHIIKIASNENDVVLDPFMGVASTAIAALNLNRMFAGCEIDESYYEASVKRVLQHMDKNRNLLNFNEVQTLKEDGANYIDDGIDW